MADRPNAQTLREKQRLEVSRQLGKEMPKVKPARAGAAAEQIAKLLRFAMKQNVVINPVGYGYYVDSFCMFLACPCDTSRKACPCPQAVGEISKDGHCICRLFWSSFSKYCDVYGIG